MNTHYYNDGDVAGQDSNNLAAALSDVRDWARTVEAQFNNSSFREALPAVKALFAILAVGCIADNSQPIALILVGEASAGKSLPLNFFQPGDKTSEYLYRSDNFTAKSFVSHKADATEEELRNTDLLPQVKDRVLITKELAPVFRGNESELTEKFAILTSVLDGEGYVSNSGAHGQRGYSERHNFRWLGATTPLSKEALKVIANLGPRMLFFAVDRERKTTEQLADFLIEADHDECKDGLRETVQECIAEFFRLFPLNCVRRGQFTISKPKAYRLALFTEVLIKLRGMKFERELKADEYAERTGEMLRDIAFGSALSNGRLEVNDNDMELVAHIALSAGPWYRQKVFAALLKCGGAGTVDELKRVSGASEPTVREYAKELEELGLATYTQGDSKVNPSTVALTEGFRRMVESKEH